MEEKEAVKEQPIDFTVGEGETFKVKISVDCSKKKPVPIIGPVSDALQGKVKEIWAEFYYQQFGVEQRIHGESIAITTVFDPQSKQVVNQRFLDVVRLEENRLKYLLKDWNLTDRFGKIELKRENGQLTGESLKKVLSVQPVILRAILNKTSMILDMGAEEDSDFPS